MAGLFLSSDHWARIADAVQAGPVGAEDAAFAWLTGLASLERAMQGLAARHPAHELLALGETSLEQSLLEDPGMADSWLALFVLESLRPVSSLERYTAILQALAIRADRLGEEQARFGRELAAYYVPLLSARLRVATPTDARLLYVGHLTRGQEHASAELWLARCDQELAQAVAVEAYLKLRQGEYAAAEELFAHLREDPVFAVEGRLGGGLALAGLDLWEEAATEIREALEEAPTPRLRLEARYLLALVLAYVDPRQARQELEALYAEAPAFADVARRLGRDTKPVSFVELVALFNSGLVADDPDILDNRGT